MVLNINERAIRIEETVIRQRICEKINSIASKTSEQTGNLPPHCHVLIFDKETDRVYGRSFRFKKNSNTHEISFEPINGLMMSISGNVASIIEMLVEKFPHTGLIADSKIAKGILESESVSVVEDGHFRLKRNSGILDVYTSE
ncbi:hypothetical protein C4559_02970 [Candidatus Microgenomates bacterium]|nr:MAG: hypothetical protein C4559_02970 [Candidatus Microgenomates bacterium]